ncbi:type II toxin-antitoxin system RelE/ParE family toxin [Pseudaminobacter sp. 19-2017]|uniref:Type II toxin-antitoxin system RelE/ParE family toxin n=1 Tax=Pseudaminobacter soli (ex Zhang et al. 2022) TaxID=2831468 RepID=A0A942E1J4_9HYPH|nr:type II toxin-antitoxin system RelE/ParE family toxin [Pseudaminobacter soli]
MRVIFLASSDEDVRWFTRYYRTTFPEGRSQARALAAMEANPFIGHPVSDREEREFSIPRTPFSLIYRIADDCIEILRLWDGRANPGRLNWLDQEE